MSEQETAKPPVNPTITLNLSLQAVNTLIMILGKQPFDDVAELVLMLRGQAIEQLQAKSEAK